MHKPITISLLMLAHLSSEFPAQDRAGSQVAGTDAGAPFTNTETIRSVTSPPIDETGESPEGPGRDGNKPLMRNRTADVPSPIGNQAPPLINGVLGGDTLPEVLRTKVRAPSATALSEKQVREARKALDTLIAFAEVAATATSFRDATRRLGLNNTTVLRWTLKLKAAGLTIPAPGEYLTADRLEPLLRALAQNHKPGGRVKYPLTENEALILRACVLARSTEDATHFALAVEDFSNHPGCSPETRALIIAEFERAAVARRLPHWPTSIRRAGMPTIQEAAWFRGPKHATHVEQVDRRGCHWIDETGVRHEIRPHTIWESDDASDNEPRRSIDPDTGAQILTRQALWTQDVYSAALLGLTQVARARDAYRIEDVADHMFDCVTTWGWPDIMRLEMGDIWNGRFFHGFIPTLPGTTHILPGWPKDITWGGLTCRITNVHKSKGKGGIEGSFNLLQAMSAHASLSIGRDRGEFEEATRALIRGHRTDDIDERFWSMDIAPESMRAVAERFNQRAKIRRMFGRHPVVPADLLKNARGPALLPSDHWRFAPIKRTAVVRGGHIEVSVDHYPRSFRFKVNGVSDNLHLDNGYTVLIAFHPGRPQQGCWLFNAEFGVRNRDGLGRAERLICAPHAEDVPQIDFSRAGDFSTRKKANAAVRRSFRAIGQAVRHDSAQDSNGKQLSVRVEGTARTVESHPSLGSEGARERGSEDGTPPAAPAQRPRRFAALAALAKAMNTNDDEV